MGGPWSPGQQFVKTELPSDAARRARRASRRSGQSRMATSSVAVGLRGGAALHDEGGPEWTNPVGESYGCFKRLGPP